MCKHTISKLITKMSPTREMSEKERREAIEEQVKHDKEQCEHSTYSGECLFYHEMCFYEDQSLCPEYGPKYKVNKK